MIKAMRKISLLGLAFVLTACMQFTLVDQSKRASFDDTFTVAPQITWSKSSTGKVELWTVDGPLLEELVFFSGIEDGEPLFSNPGFGAAKDEDDPQFQDNMTALEIQDLLVATFSQRNQFNIETQDLRPWDFGSFEGFRFEHSLVTDDGLNKKGFAVGAIHENKLYLIWFSAAAVHYFDKYKPSVENLVNSIQSI